MINRINLILRAKNITARQFAEEIGIQPSGMSHILGGRNNPSLDFAVKVLKRYPEIDANWLLLGKGAMYGNTADKETFHETSLQTSQETDHDDGLVDKETFHETSLQENTDMVEEPFHETALQDGNVKCVMMIYSDNTYEVLTPRI